MAAVASALPFASSSHSFSSDSSSSRHDRPIRMASGYPTLDRELPGGGWPASILIELLLANPDAGELRLLAPVLKRIVQGGKKLVLLAPSHISFAATCQELGIPSDSIILIEADNPTDRIASVELALKNANFGALLCWLPEAHDDHLRRLQLATADANGLTFLFRPLPAQNQPSPAPLRIICQSLPAGRMSVDIIKRRGPVHVAPIVLSLSPEIMIRPLPTRTLARPAVNVPSYALERRFGANVTMFQRTTQSR
jgi:protein ImuA